MDMRYGRGIGAPLGAFPSLDARVVQAEQRRAEASPHALEPDEAMPDRALDAQLRRLASARGHAIHLSGRLNQMLDRLRGEQPCAAQPPVSRNDMPQGAQAPLLTSFADLNASLADALDAIDRAVCDLETIA
jgi:hypothetical protein